jgi:hypothetical protein
MAPETTAQRSLAIDVTSASFALAAGERPVGIHCNAASTINGALIGDNSELAWILPAGFSPYAFRSINMSSTTKNGMRILFNK